MPLPDRYDINSQIPREALEAHAAWLIAYDEEDIEGQDEATIKPNDFDEPALPGYVTSDVRFADGTTALALVGGDFGVAALDSLDNMRIYLPETVWEFDLGPETCTQDGPGKSFFERHPNLLPMQITARMASAFGGQVPELSFSVDAKGRIRGRR